MVIIPKGKKVKKPSPQKSAVERYLEAKHSRAGQHWVKPYTRKAPKYKEPTQSIKEGYWRNNPKKKKKKVG